MDRLLSMRVFERVVDEGSLAGAARALDLSPPVVTRLMAGLEAHLGTRLLQRTTRRQALTEAGEAYLLRVRTILRDIDEAEQLASAHTAELAGTLRLHAPPVLASHVIAPRIAGFHARYPGIAIDLTVESRHEPPVEDHDITLFSGNARPGPDVVARKVVDAEAVLVATPRYLKHAPPLTQPADLAQHACLRLAQPDSDPAVWRMWCPEGPDEPLDVAITPLLVANHSDTLVRATLDGAGITSASLDLMAPYLVRGELVRVLAPWITGRLSMYAAVPTRKFIPQRTRVFLDWLVDETRRQTAEAVAAYTARVGQSG
jgi:DNA-binding transcriptional LysR family regulator